MDLSFGTQLGMLHALVRESPAYAEVALSAQLFCSLPRGAALVPATEALLRMLSRCFTGVWWFSKTWGLGL